MKENNKEIQLALYKLSKCIKDDNFQKTLENRRTTDLVVTEGIPFNCKIDLKDKQPPLTIFLKYKTKGDLRVYGSFKHQEPDANTYD